MAVGAAMLAVAASEAILSAATGLWASVTSIATAAQTAFNFALLANPIGIVIVAIVAIIAALVLLYQNVDWVREGIDNAVKWIIGAWNNTVTAINNVVNLIIAAFRRLISPIVSVFNTIKSAWDSTVGAISSAVSSVGSALGLAGGLEEMLGFSGSVNNMNYGSSNVYNFNGLVTEQSAIDKVQSIISAGNAQNTLRS